jgi:hypothetical protein
MKKVFAILAVASFVSFGACKNAPKEEVVEVAICDADGDEEEVEEEEVEEAAK